MTDLDGTASNLKSISAKINDGQGTVGALINDKTIYQKANAGATALNEDMEALKHNFLLRGFFKNRGYEDASDLTKHAIANLPPGEPAKMFEYDGQKIFNEQAKLKDEKALKEAGDYLQSQQVRLGGGGGFGRHEGRDGQRPGPIGRPRNRGPRLSRQEFPLGRHADQNSWPWKVRRYRRQR